MVKINLEATDDTARLTKMSKFPFSVKTLLNTMKAISASDNQRIQIHDNQRMQIHTSLGIHNSNYCPLQSDRILEQ